MTLYKLFEIFAETSKTHDIKLVGRSLCIYYS